MKRKLWYHMHPEGSNDTKVGLVDFEGLLTYHWVFMKSLVALQGGDKAPRANLPVKNHRPEGFKASSTTQGDDKNSYRGR